LASSPQAGPVQAVLTSLQGRTQSCSTVSRRLLPTGVLRRRQQRLWSTARDDLVIDRTSTKFGARSFAVAAPSEWTWLLHHIRALQLIDSFKAALKTYLFDCSWLNTHCSRDNATVVNRMVAAHPCNVFVVLRPVRNCLTIIIIIIVVYVFVGPRWGSDTDEHHYAAAQDLQSSVYLSSDRGSILKGPRADWVSVNAIVIPQCSALRFTDGK